MNQPQPIPTEAQQLAQRLEELNELYRQGRPAMSDAQYDLLLERLRSISPDHPFLHRVEPEAFFDKREVRHPVPMLSTDKAYTADDLQRFVDRVAKEGAEIGIQDILFRVTPKLDGLAGRDDGLVLATRGNGLAGFDVTPVLAKGMIVQGGRGLGVGEMVMVQSYFQEHLSQFFEHPRNLVVGIVASDTVNDHARRALDLGMVHFVPYSTLPYWEGTGSQLLSHIDAITLDLEVQVDYPMDGMVVEVVNEAVRQTMGATNHHYRWQIAVKRKGETAITQVVDVLWQVGRTGKVTPVLLVEPTNVSGATIGRVSAHNAGFLKKNALGPGAEIEIIRSGEVIPKVEAVLITATPILPVTCPSCGTALEQDNDFLLCPNERCPDQLVQSIEHWFKTLGTVDWFGRKTIERLVQAGYDSLEKVYALEEEDFARLDFGPVQSANLAESLALSRTRPVEDWRFLAALGIENLGLGDSRKLVQHFSLPELPNLTQGQIEAIRGFGTITSRSIVQGLQRLSPTLKFLLDLGFSIIATAQELPQEASSPLVGKHVVFTGKMHKSREEMEEQARTLGALVQSAVNAKTDYLVCGEKVGASKTNKAQQMGTTILTEQAYLRLIGAEEWEEQA